MNIIILHVYLRVKESYHKAVAYDRLYCTKSGSMYIIIIMAHMHGGVKSRPIDCAICYSACLLL